jgi:hypothetical protein
MTEPHEPVAYAWKSWGDDPMVFYVNAFQALDMCKYIFAEPPGDALYLRLANGQLVIVKEKTND